MSEDRLEEALEAMRNESVSPEELSVAQARVWERLGSPALAVCAEFQADFHDYLEDRIAGKRRMLMDDHISRCAQCRAHLAELKGERKPIPLPQSSVSWWSKWAALAAAAAVVLISLYLGRGRIDSLLAPGGPRATVASVSGELYRIPQGVLQTGAALIEGEQIRTGPAARAVLRLADGSVVDVNERTELFVRAAWSGQTIHLQRGDIIVRAAKQRRGTLRVQTRDSVASVKGTVFAVSAGLGGSVVSVIEGSVAVAQPGVNVVLRPGQQAASKAALAYPVRDAVSWSPDAPTYLQLLASFSEIEKRLAQLPPPALRTQSRLLEILPANAMLYGAIPNPSGTIREAVALAEQQSAANPVFRDWWNSGTGQNLKRLIDRMQTVAPLLGDEIVYTLSASAPEIQVPVPMIAAEIQPGKRAELTSALNALATEAGGIPLSYDLTDTLMIISDSPSNLQWVLNHRGEGATSPFAAGIAGRYQRGAGWMLGMDVELALPPTSDAAAQEITGARQVKHLFLEQRGASGVEENEVTLTFNGPRTGLASWLASSGSAGAAEYLSSDAVFALYVSSREPRQLFEELTERISRVHPSFTEDLARTESKLGAGFIGDLSAAFGTEFAMGVEGISVTGPTWVLAALANNPSTIDGSIRKLADVINAGLNPEDLDKRITIKQESVDGRIWTIMQSSISPLATVAWTYDGGYMVAASNPAAGTRAISTRNGGSALVWSPAFQQQLPSSAGLHPSAFTWLNPKGALEGLAGLMQDADLKKLSAEHDPILVVFNANEEQIHAASRTRMTSLLMDVMSLQGLGMPQAGGQPTALRRGRAQLGKR